MTRLGRRILQVGHVHGYLRPVERNLHGVGLHGPRNRGSTSLEAVLYTAMTLTTVSAGREEGKIAVQVCGFEDKVCQQAVHPCGGD